MLTFYLLQRITLLLAFKQNLSHHRFTGHKYNLNHLALTGTICQSTSTTATPPTTTIVTTSAGTTPCATFTTGGNANGAMCVFPFTYLEVTYYECTAQNNPDPWCATTADYTRDKQWGNCAGM